ncbi:MAG: hypothetical protein ACXV7D_04135 [Thermoanaerobaculia bacterium]
MSKASASYMKTVAFVVWLAAIPAVALTPPATFQAGEVVVASADPACVIDPPPPPDERITVHGRNAVKIRDVSSEVISAATYAWHAVYVARTAPPNAQSIDLLTPSGNLYPLIALPAGRFVTAMTPLRGDLLALVYDGATPELWRIDERGVTIDRVSLPQYEHYIRSIDVAADQCTMFYATVSSVERFDICARRSLEQFAQQSATDIRVLPDGGVLVAGGTQLTRFDAIGNVVGRFGVTTGPEGIGALTLDQNPSVAWIVTTFGCGSGVASVMQVNVATGSIVAGPASTSRAGGFAIAVQGEWHAAVDRVPGRRRAVR